MLIDRATSTLLVIDMQDSLLKLTQDWQRTLDNCCWLVQVAQRLQVPLLMAEQYPRGLGRTNEELLKLVPPQVVADKTVFSCVAAGCMPELTSPECRQAVLVGIEAHVCVLQTALELKQSGKEVFVVADTISSRNEADKDLALRRMVAHGVELVSKEMVAFEWLRRSGTPEFKDISQNFLR